jgi:hypothetical protein
MTHWSLALSEFDAVVVANGVRLELERGPQRPLEIDADEGFAADLELAVVEGVLRIGRRSTVRLFAFDPSTTVVRATAPRLRSLAASGNAKVLATLAPVERLAVAASGGAEVRLLDVDVATLRASASGGAVLVMRGRAAEVELQLSGAGALKGEPLKADRLAVDGSSGGIGRLWVGQRATGHLSGGATLELEGPARSLVSTSGGASVAYRE